jgi:hypothetical protein
MEVWSAPFCGNRSRVVFCNGFSSRSVGTWRSHFCCRGRHVRGFCVTGLPFCAGQLCLHLPVTFKAQGFKSRGGGTFVASALLASPSVQDFQQLSVVFVSPALPPLRLLFVLGGCVDYWWIGTTRASDSAVLSRCCMVPACAARRIRVCKGRSAI